MTLHAFVSERTTGRLGQMQLMVFLVTSAMIIVGRPFHFLFYWMGNDGRVLQSASVAIWLCAIVILGLYLKKRLRLETAFLSLAISSQLLTSFRILYLTLACTPEQQFLHHELIIMNEALAFSNFLLSCIGMVRKAPSWVLGLFIVNRHCLYHQPRCGGIPICPALHLCDGLCMGLRDAHAHDLQQDFARNQ